MILGFKEGYEDDCGYCIAGVSHDMLYEVVEGMLEGGSERLAITLPLVLGISRSDILSAMEASETEGLGRSVAYFITEAISERVRPWVPAAYRR
jgi:hypothetical protein